MQRYNGQLLNQFPNTVTGISAAGAQITVRVKSTGALATLYAENSTSGATLSNPLTADGKGYYGFYAPDGVYTLDVSLSGTPQLEIQLQDVASLQSQFNNAVSNAGYIPVGTFSAGCTVSQANGVVSDGVSYWRWDGSLPKTVTAGSAPVPTGVGGWVLTGGAAGVYEFEAQLAAIGSTKVISGIAAKDYARKYYEFTSVKDFGAVGDGVADDTAAIQAVLNSGKFYIFFPVGTYRITASLIVSSNTTIYGAGAASIVKADADGVDVFTTSTGTAKSNIEISNLLIDGGGQTTNIYTGRKLCRGIYATNISNLRINDVTIRKMGVVNQSNPQNDATTGGYGIFITSRFGTATNVRISGCTVQQIAGGGVQYGDGINVDAHESFVGASFMDVVISDCYVTTVGRHCYTVGGGVGESIPSGVKIINCYGEKSACDFLDIEEGYDVLVDGCTVAKCGNDQTYYNPVAAFGVNYRLLAGIATGTDSKRIVISNTTFRECYFGVTYGATDVLLISNCTFESSAKSDITQGLSTGATGFRISNCVFRTTGKPVIGYYNITAEGGLTVSGCDFHSSLEIYGSRGGTFDSNTYRAGFAFKGGSGDNARNRITSCTFLDYAGSGVTTENGQVHPDNIIESCEFYGSGNMTNGVDIAFNSMRRTQINGNIFRGLTGAGVKVNFGNGQHFFDARGNSFVNCADGVLVQQSIRDCIISGNTFSNITGWCIRIFDINAGEPMPLGPVIQGNIASESCVNGLQIALAGGSYDYTMVTGNNMHNCSGTKWSLAAGNANGVVANNITT